jgi:hypothetical protein
LAADLGLDLDLTLLSWRVVWSPTPPQPQFAQDADVLPEFVPPE